MRWRAHKTRGSLVLVAFCLIAVVSLGLASYMNACWQTINHSTREYHNRNARYLAENGLEEALWQLNNGRIWTGSGPNSDQAWTVSGTTRTLTLSGYAMGSGRRVISPSPTYEFGSGSTGQVTITVTNATGPTPSIQSVAVVTLPSGKTYIKTLNATTILAPQFNYAVASSAGTVTFSSGGTIDSYNSTSGPYTAPSTSTGHAAVVAGKTLTLGSVTLKGYAATYGTTPSITTGSIKGYGAPATPAVVASRVGTNAFIPLYMPNTPTPSTWDGTITSSTTTIGTAGVLRYYRSTTNFAKASGTLNVNGPTKWVVNGTFSLTSTGRITVNSGASLEIFVTGATATVAGSGGIRNQSPNPTNPIPARVAFYHKGTGNVSWNTSRAYYGVIYLTNTSTSSQTITINTTAAIFGAIVSNNTITFSGSTPTLHYDLALRTATIGATADPAFSTPYVIQAVTETIGER